MTDNRNTIFYTLSHGHSFRKHAHEFADPRLGPVVTDSPTHSTLESYMRTIFNDPSTMVATARAAPPDYPYPVQYIYNERANTLVILNPDNVGDFGTVLRPEEGLGKFESLVRRASANGGVSGVTTGPDAVNRAVSQFETQLARNPRGWATLEANAARIGEDVQQPRGRQPQAPAPDNGAAPHNLTSGADDAARAATAAAAAEEATRLANEILQNSETLGFLADSEGRTMHFFSEEHSAIVSIDAEGNKTIRMGGDEILDEFIELQQRAASEFGDVSQIVNGGLNGVDGLFQGLNAGRVSRVLEFFGDAARVLGKTASVLGPAGMVVAGAATAAEVEGLYQESDIARTLGIIPSDEALHQYYAILGAHATQATVDPSVAAGELITQEAFDLWCDTYDIPQEWRERLEPESLIELVFGDGNPSPDANAAYNDPFFDIYDNLPADISDNMPPEVQSLVELRNLILQAEADLEGNTDFAVRENIIDRLQNAENMYQEQYDLMLDDGQIEIVQAFMAEQAPAALAEEPDAAPAADEAEHVAEYGGQNQSLPSPM